MENYEVHVVNGSYYRVEVIEAESAAAARKIAMLNEGDRVIATKKYRECKPREKKTAIVTFVYLVRYEDTFEMVRHEDVKVVGCSGTGKNAIRDIRGLLRDMYPEAMSPFYIEKINGNIVD